MKDFIDNIAKATLRFLERDGLSRAAALAYSTLLALVPMTVVSIQFLGGFNIGRDKAVESINGFLSQILPTGSEAEALTELQNQISGFLLQLSSNISSLSAITVLILLITTVALFNTIQSAMDDVWQLKSNTKFLTKLFYHWIVFSAWVLLIVLSVYASAHVASLPLGLRGPGAIIAPHLIAWFALTALYLRVPPVKVRLRDAAIGALIASALFEILKRGFAYYVGLSTTYSALYGILASIPLFLFWLYLLWVLVIYGAHIAFQFGNFSLRADSTKYKTKMGEFGSLIALRLLQEMVQSFKAGEEPLNDRLLAVRTGTDLAVIRKTLDVLSKASLVSTRDQEDEKRVLLKSPQTINVQSVISLFEDNFQQDSCSKVLECLNCLTTEDIKNLALSDLVNPND